MITEDYVSFEIAKLLQEKGIEDDCEYTGWIGKSGNHYFPDDTYLDDDEMIAAQKDRKEYIPLISLQMAMKWLREVHNLHCVVDYDFVLGWYCQITSLKETVEYDYEEMKHYHPDKDSGFSSPEEACEAAIKYYLENLI